MKRRRIVLGVGIVLIVALALSIITLHRLNFRSVVYHETLVQTYRVIHTLSTTPVNNSPDIADCKPENIRAVAESSNAAMGTGGMSIRFANVSGHPCRITGATPKLTMVRGGTNLELRQLPQPDDRSSDNGETSPRIAYIPNGKTEILASYESATAFVSWKISQQVDRAAPISLTATLPQLGEIAVVPGANASNGNIISTDPGLDITVSTLTMPEFISPNDDPLQDSSRTEPCRFAIEDFRADSPGPSSSGEGSGPLSLSLTLRHLGLQPCKPDSIIAIAAAGNPSRPTEILSISQSTAASPALSADGTAVKKNLLAPGKDIIYSYTCEQGQPVRRPTSWIAEHYGSWKPAPIDMVPLPEQSSKLPSCAS
jgi:hypothetical protein